MLVKWLTMSLLLHTLVNVCSISYYPIIRCCKLLKMCKSAKCISYIVTIDAHDFLCLSVHYLILVHSHYLSLWVCALRWTRFSVCCTWNYVLFYVSFLVCLWLLACYHYFIKALMYLLPWYFSCCSLVCVNVLSLSVLCV